MRKVTGRMREHRGKVLLTEWDLDAHGFRALVTIQGSRMPRTVADRRSLFFCGARLADFHGLVVNVDPRANHFRLWDLDAGREEGFGSRFLEQSHGLVWVSSFGPSVKLVDLSRRSQLSLLAWWRRSSRQRDPEVKTSPAAEDSPITMSLLGKPQRGPTDRRRVGLAEAARRLVMAVGESGVRRTRVAKRLWARGTKPLQREGFARGRQAPGKGAVGGLRRPWRRPWLQRLRPGRQPRPARAS